MVSDSGKNDKRYPGKSDKVLPKYKTRIYVHGCFWHGHNCNTGKLYQKQEKTLKKQRLYRNKRNKIELQKQEWQVIAIRQCELKNRKTQEEILNDLINTLHNK